MHILGGIIMRTFTLDRVDANDFLFVALNDATYTDWKNSRDFYQAEAKNAESFTEVIGGTIRKFFGKR